MSNALHILTRTDLADIDLTPEEVIELVEEGYSAFARGDSRCPVKLMMALPHAERDAVSYSMLGYDGSLEHLGFKTSYRQGSTSAEKYYTTISLYNDTTGLPFALMDCQRVGAARTPATTAITAKYAAREGATSALMIGTGIQGAIHSRTCSRHYRASSGCACTAPIPTGSPRAGRRCGTGSPTGNSNWSTTCPLRSPNPTSWWWPPGALHTRRYGPSGCGRVAC